MSIRKFKPAPVPDELINQMLEDAMALLDEVLPAGVNGTKNKVIT